MQMASGRIQSEGQAPKGEWFFKAFPIILLLFEINRGFLHELFDGGNCACVAAPADRVFYLSDCILFLFLWIGLTIIYNQLDNTRKGYKLSYGVCMVVWPFEVKDLILDELIFNNNDKVDWTDIPGLIIALCIVLRKWKKKKT